jgi:hypothetical protein
MNITALNDALPAAFVAAIIFAVLGAFFRFVTRRSGKFSGDWKGSYTSFDKVENAEVIKLSSFLLLVWGHSTCEWTQEGVACAEKYRIWGLCRGTVLVASYLTRKSGSHDVGVFVIRLLPDEDFGEGAITTYESKDMKRFDWVDLKTYPYKWERVK